MFIRFLIYFAVLCTSLHAQEVIRHIFVATDESREQLLYVDEFNPENDWTVQIGPNRDLQVEGDRIVISTPMGYAEYHLKTGQRIKEVQIQKGIRSVRRKPNGHTVLASKDEIIELNTKDTVEKRIQINMGKAFRLLRLRKNGNFLFTGGKTIIKEATPEGQIIGSVDLKRLAPKTSKPYFVMETSAGERMASTGYGASLLFLNDKGELKRKVDATKAGLKFPTKFFAESQVLTNGNIVVAHWTGHGKRDSHKAPQVLEFDQDGKLVWSWHDPVRAGSLHGIVVLK